MSFIQFFSRNVDIIPVPPQLFHMPPPSVVIIKSYSRNIHSFLRAIRSELPRLAALGALRVEAVEEELHVRLLATSVIPAGVLETGELENMPLISQYLLPHRLETLFL